MVGKRVLVVDAYNVIKVFRQLGVSFEEAAPSGALARRVTNCLSRQRAKSWR